MQGESNEARFNCRAAANLMQTLCQRAQREFTLNLPSAAKYFANIRNLNHKAQDATMKLAVFIENEIIKGENKKRCWERCLSFLLTIPCTRKQQQID